MNIRNSKVETDGNNTILNKRKSSGRIDLLQAGIIAAGLVERAANRPKKKHVHASISLDQMSA